MRAMFIGNKKELLRISDRIDRLIEEAHIKNGVTYRIDAKEDGNVQIIEDPNQSEIQKPVRKPKRKIKRIPAVAA